MGRTADPAWGAILASGKAFASGHPSLFSCCQSSSFGRLDPSTSTAVGLDTGPVTFQAVLVSITGGVIPYRSPDSSVKSAAPHRSSSTHISFFARPPTFDALFARALGYRSPYGSGRMLPCLRRSRT